MDLDKAIKSRKSVRKFKDKKPDWREIIECIDSARYAPMAGNNFTLRFVLVNNEEKIQKISDACQQNFISKTKYLIVVCSDSSRLINAYEERGEKFNKQQVGAAIENILLKIQEFKLATCWIGYFVEEEVKQILKIPEKIQVEAILPIGFEKERAYTKRAKTDLDNVLYFNQYKNKKMKKPNRVD